MTKNMMLKALSDYMASKNVDYISLSDYKADDKAPVRDYLLRRKYGSWNRVIAAAIHRFPVTVSAPAPAPEPVKEKVVEADDE
jgi:hypothetical protein|tara:strand:- start:726 stop:974 length:249 start_codon:yes stop_codon:yes gene_type:complete